MQQIITRIAEEDRAVIVGRGGQYILKNNPTAYHVLLVADTEARIAFLKRKYNMLTDAARQTVAREDRRRHSMYRKFGHADFDQPHHYHLVLNMEMLRMEAAIDLIHELVIE